jgi:hypothetical protein
VNSDEVIAQNSSSSSTGSTRTHFLAGTGSLHQVSGLNCITAVTGRVAPIVMIGLPSLISTSRAKNATSHHSILHNGLMLTEGYDPFNSRVVFGWSRGKQRDQNNFWNA